MSGWRARIGGLLVLGAISSGCSGDDALPMSTAELEQWVSANFDVTQVGLTKFAGEESPTIREVRCDSGLDDIVSELVACVVTVDRGDENTTHDVEVTVVKSEKGELVPAFKESNPPGPR